MLVISQKVGGRVLIGPDIVIHVVEAGSGKVRLAIEAPRTVRIERAEGRPEAPPAK